MLSYEASFQEWKEHRLNFSLGRKNTAASAVSTNHPQQLQNGGVDMQAMAALIAQTTQNAIFADQRNSGGTAPPSQTQPSAVVDKDKGKLYSDHEVANILGS